MQGELENLKSLLSAFAQEEPVLQKLLQKGEVEKLAEYMKADKAGKIVYAEAFRARPLEERRALAYIYGILLLNPVYGSPFNNFITNRFPQTAIDCPPFVNRGSVGPSGMWSIYAIHPEFFVDRSCQLFYTDEDIAGDADAAKWLAADIERESSGVSSAHMQQIQNLSWGDRVSLEPMYAVTFSLSPDCLKSEIRIKYNTVPIHKEEPYLIVIPRHGEYRTILGQTRSFGKGQLNQILATDYWCTK